jgi:hypothetical protein
MHDVAQGHRKDDMMDEEYRREGKERYERDKAQEM